MLEKKVGPCRMATDNIKYYFDPKMKKCLPFNYGEKFYDLIPEDPAFSTGGRPFFNYGLK